MSSVIASVASNVIGSVISGNAAESAAQTQANAATQAASMQQASTQAQLAQQMQIYQQNLANQQPWINQGQAASSQLSNLLGTSGNTTAQGYGSLMQNPTSAQVMAQMAPNYDFMLNQGLQAVNAQGAATGQLQTGQGIKNVTQYAENTAQGGYQQAYQNYVTNQTNAYNRLSGMSSLGQNSAAGVGNNGVQTGSNMANTAQAGTSAVTNYLTGAAAANAAGQVGTANAITGGLNGAMNSAVMNNYLQGLNNNNNNLGGSMTSMAAMPTYTSMIQGYGSTPVPSAQLAPSP